MALSKVTLVNPRFDTATARWKVTLTLKDGSTRKEEIYGLSGEAEASKIHLQGVISRELQPEYDLEGAEWDFDGK